MSTLNGTQKRLFLGGFAVVCYLVATLVILAVTHAVTASGNSAPAHHNPSPAAVKACKGLPNDVLKSCYNLADRKPYKTYYADGSVKTSTPSGLIIVKEECRGDSSLTTDEIRACLNQPK